MRYFLQRIHFKVTILTVQFTGACNCLESQEHGRELKIINGVVIQNGRILIIFFISDLIVGPSQSTIGNQFDSYIICILVNMSFRLGL